MLNWITNYVAERTLSSMLSKDVWFQSMLKYVSEKLSPATDAHENSFIEFLQISGQAKEDEANYYAQRIAAISKGAQHIHDVREWAIELAVEYAASAVVISSGDSLEYAYGQNHSATGLGDYLEELLPIVCPESKDRETPEYWAQILGLQFFKSSSRLSTVDYARKLLNDAYPEEKDWLHPLIRSSASLRETELRTQIGLPIALPMDALQKRHDKLISALRHTDPLIFQAVI